MTSYTYKSNTMVTSGAGTACPPGAPAVITSF